MISFKKYQGSVNSIQVGLQLDPTLLVNELLIERQLFYSIVKRTNRHLYKLIGSIGKGKCYLGFLEFW